MTDHLEPLEPGDALDPADERLLNSITAFLANEGLEGLQLGSATLDALDRHVDPVPVPATLQRQLTQVAREAEIDVQFLASLSQRHQQPTLGSYLSFLRRRVDWTVSETAKRLRLEFQWLADLERDALPPTLISAAKLERLLKRLKGTLEMTEQVLGSTIKAPRYLSTSGRDSLYRRGSTSSQGVWAEPPDSPSLQENPAYQEEVEALSQLREQLRTSWRP